MTTWRDVKWYYDGNGSMGCVLACVNSNSEHFIVCIVPAGDCQDEIGRAIAHAWNVDLAAARSWRELFGVDDLIKTRED